MTNPLVQAFFVGRAVAEVANERLEVAFTDALSELGKLDAELKEQMRQFTSEVMVRANQAAETASSGTYTTPSTPNSSEPDDLQAMIDELRAEIALLRNELQKYRASSAS
jgi:polyhydroxyalkanoate synthesis regulator phasin